MDSIGCLQGGLLAPAGNLLSLERTLENAPSPV